MKYVITKSNSTTVIVIENFEVSTLQISSNLQLTTELHKHKNKLKIKLNPISLRQSLLVQVKELILAHVNVKE